MYKRQVQNGGKSQALTSLPYYQGSTMHALYQAGLLYTSAVAGLIIGGEVVKDLVGFVPMKG